MHVCIPSASVACEMGQETEQASQPGVHIQQTKRSCFKPRGRRALKHVQLCNGAHVSLSEHTEKHIHTVKAKSFFLCLKTWH